MRELMMIAVAALVSAAAVAAQCQGSSQNGSKCRRTAIAGGNFCARHANQAVKGNDGVASDGDDVRCRAMTDAGTRCRHKKDGRSCYCKQHAAFLVPPKIVTRCRAIGADGRQCTEKTVNGRRYCKSHME